VSGLQCCCGCVMLWLWRHLLLPLAAYLLAACQTLLCIAVSITGAGYLYCYCTLLLLLLGYLLHFSRPQWLCLRYFLAGNVILRLIALNPTAGLCSSLCLQLWALWFAKTLLIAVVKACTSGSLMMINMKILGEKNCRFWIYCALGWLFEVKGKIVEHK